MFKVYVLVEVRHNLVVSVVVSVTPAHVSAHTASPDQDHLLPLVSNAPMVEFLRRKNARDAVCVAKD